MGSKSGKVRTMWFPSSVGHTPAATNAKAKQNAVNRQQCGGYQGGRGQERGKGSIHGDGRCDFEWGHTMQCTDHVS